MRDLCGYYDRQGNRMKDMKEWGEKLHDITYKRVVEDTLPNGLWISTVWLGMDYSFGDDTPPLIFESMAFRNKDDMRELDCARYATEEEAVAGHKLMVEKWKTEPIPE